MILRLLTPFVKSAIITTKADMNISEQYLAGFIDGEGCITITINRRKDRQPQHCLTICVAQSDKWILDAMCESTGLGKVFTASNSVRPWMKATKSAWQWRIADRQALELLKTLQPHLLVKQAQAVIAIEFAERKSKNPTGKRVLDEEIAIRERARLAITELNQL